MGRSAEPTARLHPAGGPAVAGAGLVDAFDDQRGLGEVTSDDGVTYPFHCTAIADGTRTIAVGAAVTFEVVAGRMGRWEAARLVAV